MKPPECCAGCAAEEAAADVPNEDSFPPADYGCGGCTCCSEEECRTFAEDPCDRERCACWVG